MEESFALDRNVPLKLAHGLFLEIKCKSVVYLSPLFISSIYLPLSHLFYLFLNLSLLKIKKYLFFSFFFLSLVKITIVLIFITTKLIIDIE